MVDLPDQDDRNFRPKTLRDFIGQEAIKAQLQLMIQGVLRRRHSGEANATLDHILFVGPPGLGKTTLAEVVANMLGARFTARNATAFQRPGDLAALLVTLKGGDILFLDEIHKLGQLFELLYNAMEDFKLTIPAVKGTTEVREISLPRFTLIGATTEQSMLPKPMLDRFGRPLALKLYDLPDLERIAARDAALMDYLIDEDACREIARRSRGTPRLLIYLLQRCRDLADQERQDITGDIAKRALAIMQVDELGLDEGDRQFLKMAATLNGGKPVGIKALAGALGTSEQNLIEGVEPYLLRAHLVKRTSGGRALTQKGWEYIRPTLEAEGLIEPTLESGLELPADEEGEELAEEARA